MSEYGLPTPCNCCAPICPTPIDETESKSSGAGQCGIKNEAIGFALWNGRLYHNVDNTITESYLGEFYDAVVSPQPNPSVWTTSSEKGLNDSGECITTTVTDGFDQTFYVFPTLLPTTVVTNTSISESYSNPSTGSRTDITTFSNPATNLELENAINASLENDTWGAGTGEALFDPTFSTIASGPSEFYSSLEIRKARYRYRIAEGTNTYMKYVVEETFTPADHDPQNPDVSPIVVVEKTFEWLGGITVDEVFIPATPGDDDTWATDWETLETSEPGTKTHALIKYKCYTGGPWVYL